MRQQFKRSMLELAEQDSQLVLVFGDISVFLFREFQTRFPERFYNLGICENTLVSVAAGLSAGGFRPFVHTICPFLTDRCFEQIKTDLCYNRYPANIVTTGASFDYAWDGATHHCYTDLAMLRLLPGVEVMQPGSPAELDALIKSQYRNDQTSYFRMSDHSHGVEWSEPVTFGKAHVLRDGGHPITVMTAGPILKNVLEACQDLPVNLVYHHTIKPLDHAVVERFRETQIVVVHDAFGLKEAIQELPALNVTAYGLPDQFCVWYGTVHDLRREVGLDPAGIRQRLAALV
jgi:transketolase